MDMEAYLGLALSEITKAGSYSQDRPPWPPEQELEALSIQSDGLFIDATIVIRYTGGQFMATFN